MTATVPATQIHIRELAALTILLRFQPVTYTGDDGYPEAKLMNVIGVALHDGREFFLSNVRMVPRFEMPGSEAVQRYRPGVVIQRILDAQYIDLIHWVEIENTSFEAKMQDAWEIEQRDRLDHGEPAFH